MLEKNEKEQILVTLVHSQCSDSIEDSENIHKINVEDNHKEKHNIGKTSDCNTIKNMSLVGTSIGETSDKANLFIGIQMK